MRRFIAAAIIVFLLTAGVAGCGTLLLAILATKQTTVRLVNNGQFTVEATLHYGNDKDASTNTLVTQGTQLQYTLQPGATPVEVSRNCAALQAVIVDNAQLDTTSNSGPQTSSNVVREVADFDCGDTIVFTFDHAALGFGFHVTTTVEHN